ncbi:MAG: UDP-3-O-(3-hydroxymyristoyl)glucosamine N-acyltransferase, partial [Candidatus Omnitrophica bacterium]|nr:UDP-3-O-(3-hydroxymyristoyl)glucosamine N-acyltransferase [Candidatus Omnitrophota bacterium]
MQKTVAEIAKIIEGEVVGDASVVIKGVSGIKEAKPGEIAFVANPKYLSLINETGASAIITPKDVKEAAKPIVRTENPSLAFARVVS